jgi:hypothetical protein
VHLLYHDLVLEAERERANKREEARFALAAALRDRGRSSVRHRLAVALAGVSRASAAGVRRLDACLADDLASQLTGNP